MADIIQDMSQVTISDDLIKQINMDELLRNFKENYERLNEFKQTKNEYEQRGIGKKLWHAISFDKTMENAQMDATEVQAEFSKILGQLTVVNIMLSRHLNMQQNQLSEQQSVIKKQTTQIESQTHKLEDQHDILAKQNAELDKLVKEYFELKGLTEDGARKLIATSKEIGNTRDILLKSVAESIGDLKEWISSEHSEMDSKISVLEKNVNETQAKLLSTVRESQEFLSKQQEQTLGEVSLRVNIFEENVNENLLSAKNEYQSSMSILKQEQTKQSEKLLSLIDSKVSDLEHYVNDKQGKLVDIVRECEGFFSKQQEKTLHDISHKIEGLENNIHENLLNAKNEYKSSISILKQEQTTQNNDITSVNDNLIILTDNFKNLTDDFNLYRNVEHKKIQKLTIAFGVITIALSSITSYLYLFVH